jgi:hypothetical protein
VPVAVRNKQEKERAENERLKRRLDLFTRIKARFWMNVKGCREFVKILKMQTVKIDTEREKLREEIEKGV